MTTVYLIRHAHAQGNLDQVFQGRYDGKLTELGLEQLDKLAKRCRDLELKRIYSSPLSRAYETAAAVNRYYQYPIITDDALLEIGGGDWEGQKWADFEAWDAKQNDNWYHAPWDFCAPNGEPMRQVFARTQTALTRIARENPNSTVAVVSHGCAIWNMLTFAKGKTIEQMDRADLCDNTALSKVEFDEKWNPRLIWQNDSSHLSTGLKTSVHALWEKEEE